MIGRLKALFERALPAAGGGSDAHTVQLATAVLLVEVLRADGRFGDAEREAVVAALQRQFALPADEEAALLELAHERSRTATDLHAFTSALDERLDMAQKIAVVEAMWRVAFADGELEAHERHVLWRVADLLHVPHGAYVAAKARARQAAAE